MIVDFHAHFFPDSVGKYLPDPVLPVYGQVRKRMRQALWPYSEAVHRAQVLLRVLPESFRKNIEGAAGVAMLPGLLVESTAQDLSEAMTAAHVDYALVIAHPPYTPNDAVVELAASDSRFIAAVNIPPGTSRPGVALKNLIQKRGAKVLKIHPAADGEGVDSPRYRALLRAASDLGVPVVLHTGCVHAALLYKDAKQGEAQRFSQWFETYRSTRFILAHMNFHSPSVAMDLAEEYPNLYVDTSWQPAEVISEAVRRMGAERVLFGSDWPLLGSNMGIGIQRIRDCVEGGMITSSQSELLLGANAARVLGISAGTASDAT